MKNARITAVNEIKAKEIASALLKAGAPFYFEPMPYDRHEFTSNEADVERIRGLAALDEGQPLITKGVEVGGDMQARVWVKGALHWSVVNDLISSSQRFSFQVDKQLPKLGVFSVAIENLHLFDQKMIQVRVSPR